MFVMRRLEHVAEAVKLGDSREARKAILMKQLGEIVLPTVFKLPLNPHRSVSIAIIYLMDVLSHTSMCWFVSPINPRFLCFSSFVAPSAR